MKNLKSGIIHLFSETRELLRDDAEGASVYLLHFFQDTFRELFSFYSFCSLFSPYKYFNGASVSLYQKCNFDGVALCSL
jgi:hypothetical protein